MKTALVFLMSLTLCLGVYYPSGYTPLSFKSVTPNSVLGTAYNVGLNSTIASLIQYGLPNNSYYVTGNISVAQRVSSTTTYYFFEVNVTNLVDYVIDARFIVSKKSSTYKLYSLDASVTQIIVAQFTPVDPDLVAGNPVIQNLENSGFQQVVQQNISVQLPNMPTDFTITQTLSIQAQSLDSGIDLYEFNVTANNSNGDSVYTVYVVSTTYSAAQPVLLDSAFVAYQSGTYPDSADLSTNGFIPLCATDLASTVVQSVISSGIDQYLYDLKAAGKIGSTNFASRTVNNAWSLVSASETEYRFQVTLSDGINTTVCGVLIVSYAPDTGAILLERYGFTVTYVSQ